MKFSYNWMKDFVKITTWTRKTWRIQYKPGEIGSVIHRTRISYFDAEINSNRSDCFCMTGMAREASAILGKKVKAPPDSSRAFRVKSKVAGFPFPGERPGLPFV